MSLYLADENSATMLVNASISHTVGVPYHQHTYGNSKGSKDSESLDVQLYLEGHGPLLSNSSAIEVGRLTEVMIDLSNIPARLKEYQLTAIAKDRSGNSFYANTTLTKLPLRSDNGTTTKVDNLYGGLAVRKTASTEWHSIFPYTYYGMLPYPGVVKRTTDRRSPMEPLLVRKPLNSRRVLRHGL